MRLAQNVEMLELTGMGTIYPVLTWDQEHLVLIDAGFPGQAPALIKAIEDAGFKAENLTEIMITHQDIDHIGCIKGLLEVAPHAKVLAHAIEADYISGAKTPIKLANLLNNESNLDEQKKQWLGMLQKGFGMSYVSVTQLLEDGEVLDFCGGIRVIHTPGHTPGHIVLFLEESGLIIGGDAINIEDGKLIGANPVHTDDPAAAEASLSKMQSLNPKGYVAYHGGYLKV
jgi:glyoxylase-like metal-dependent hydrolase (beta-lactamase superfamily II)